jgi:hypothetical protein
MPDIDLMWPFPQEYRKRSSREEEKDECEEKVGKIVLESDIE